MFVCLTRSYDIKMLTPAILSRPPAFANAVAVTGCGMHSPVSSGGAHDGGGRYCEWTTLDISVHLYGTSDDLLIIAVNTAPMNVSSVFFDLSALTENILNRNGCAYLQCAYICSYLRVRVDIIGHL